MKPKDYIGGKEGTAGLQIYDRLQGRDGSELLLIENPDVRGIDASMAHRVAAGWDYGLSELSVEFKAAIEQSCGKPRLTSVPTW